MPIPYTRIRELNVLTLSNFLSLLRVLMLPAIFYLLLKRTPGADRWALILMLFAGRQSRFLEHGPHGAVQEQNLPAESAEEALSGVIHGPSGKKRRSRPPIGPYCAAPERNHPIFRGMVREGGFEPPHLAVQDPKSCASANSATLAPGWLGIVEGWGGRGKGKGGEGGRGL